MLGRTFICIPNSVRLCQENHQRAHACGMLVLTKRGMSSLAGVRFVSTAATHPKTTKDNRFVSKERQRQQKQTTSVEKHFIGYYSLQRLCLTTFMTIKKCRKELIFILFLSSLFLVTMCLSSVFRFHSSS